MPKKSIRAEDAKNGMILDKDVFLDNGVVLIPQGTEINNEAKSLLAKHKIPMVDVEYQDVSIPAEEVKGKNTLHFKEFREKFEVAKDDISNRIQDVIFKNKEVDVHGLIHSLNMIINQSSNSMDLCDMLYYMKETAKGIYVHSISVALTGQLLAGWLNLGQEEKELIGLCGLLHDIGKLKLPIQILNRSESLTGIERERYEKHPVYGYNLIKEKNVDFQVQQAVLTHHERLDGSGYPLKLTAGKITSFSRLLAIADTYDRMISRQPEREAMCPFDVVHEFEVNGFNKYDTNYLMVFLSNILNNFVHFKVLLSNGQTGEIIFINKSNLSRPIVQVGDAFLDLSRNTDVRIAKILTE